MNDEEFNRLALAAGFKPYENHPNIYQNGVRYVTRYDLEEELAAKKENA